MANAQCVLQVQEHGLVSWSRAGWDQGRNACVSETEPLLSKQERPFPTVIPVSVWLSELTEPHCWTLPINKYHSGTFKGLNSLFTHPDLPSSGTVEKYAANYF